MKSITVSVLGIAAGMLVNRLAAAQSMQPPVYDDTATGTAVHVVEADQPYQTSHAHSRRQGELASFIAYDFSIPLGSMRDFMASVSPLGFEWQFRGWVRDNISVGLGAEWSSFIDDRPRTTIIADNASITASAYDRMQMLNVRVTPHYYFEVGDGNVRPYIGPQIGFGWSWFQAQIADFERSDSEFSWIFGGEVGALFGEKPTFMANVRYSWMPGAEFLNAVSNVQTLSMQVGIGY